MENSFVRTNKKVSEIYDRNVKDVYRYLPAGCDGIVAVKLDIINEITDKDKILEFYNYYSIIKDSSEEVTEDFGRFLGGYIR